MASTEYAIRHIEQDEWPLLEDFLHEAVFVPETPSFSIAPCKPFRGEGIGTAMMGRLLDELRDAGYARVSLSVQKANPVLHLYEGLGFRIVGDGEDGTEWLMVHDLRRR